jgi:heme exporter protein B
VRKTLALVRKDLMVEARGRDTLPLMLGLSLATTLILAFTLPGAPDRGRALFADVVSGFMWLTVLFSGLIGFARSFEIERDEGAMDAMLLVPLDRSALFVAKAVVNLVLIAAVEAVLIPAFALFFNLDLTRGWLVLLAVVVLADVGFIAIGTLFASVASQTRSRELVLPLLALPALVPVFIAALELTSELLSPAGAVSSSSRVWFGVLVAFDVVFGVLGALTYEYVIE